MSGQVLTTSAVLLGRRDAIALLVLRVVRRVSLLLIPVGIGVALAAGVSQSRLGTQFDTLSGWAQSLLSPLWLLGIAILLRIAVAPAAYLAAVVAEGGGAKILATVRDSRSAWKVMTDAFRVAGGLRALRWTYAVRAVAVDLAGSPGVVLKRCEQAAGAAAWAAWVVLALGSVVVRA